MKRLSSLDAQFLAAENGNFGSQYCGLAIFDTSEHVIDAAVMRERLERALPTCPPLHWKVIEVPFNLDHPVVVETGVNLDDHVTESTLDSPDYQALSVAAAQILATKLDRSRPLWRMHIIHGLPGRTAIVITVHHAMADGIAANEILSALVDGSKTLKPVNARGSDPDPGRGELARAGLNSLPGRWIRAIRAAPETIAHLDQVPALRALPGVHAVASRFRRDADAQRLDAPRTRFTTKLSPGRSVAFGTVSLDVIKAVKNQYGYTVNDVVIALCAGALRRRLLATDGLPAEPLVAYIPVSTRLPDAEDRFGNAITSIIAPIPTHLDDLTDRLDFAHATLKTAKRRTHEAPPTLLADVNDPIPTPIFGIAARGLMDLIASRFVRPPVNLIISNVAGSPKELTIAGAPLIGSFPLSVVFSSFALNITVVSYQKNLDIGIVGDAVALPDGWDLVEDFHRELEDLGALTCTDGRTAR